ncbi:MAG: hypothetical protein GY699_15470, partial [Desulfobacteraceae bacterium]|nr:hypothetical protein [Desulfobacteraceae bacterium]
MNFIFIHPDFPGPFGYQVKTIGRDKKNKVVFITSESKKEIQIPGVKKIIFLNKKEKKK